jgi:site-specific recombinase XerD
MHYLLAEHVAAAAEVCPSLKRKQGSRRVLRHKAAMDLLQAGVAQSVIPLRLGQESIETTQTYLDADLESKQRASESSKLPDGELGRYRPDDSLLEFRRSL